MSQNNLITIGVADMKISNDPNATLVTYSLGSCLGIVVYDPHVKVGGILHAMLPEAKEEKNSNHFNPYKYIDSGVPLLFKETYKYGSKKNHLTVKVAGGAQILDDSGYFNIGKRNLATLRKLFWKNGVMVDSEHVEGTVARTVRLKISTGEVTLSIGRNKEIVL